MSAQSRIAPDELARAERLLMRWPRSIRLLRVVQCGRAKALRAEARARAALKARIRAALADADLQTLHELAKRLEAAP